MRRVVLGLAAVAVVVSMAHPASWTPAATPTVWTDDAGAETPGMPPTLEVAVSPWVAWRLDRGVLDDAEALFNDAAGSALEVRLQPTVAYRLSDVTMTGAGFQMARCGRTHGLARPEVAAGTDGVTRLSSGRIWLCSNATAHGRDHQVAIIAHEVGHLLGFGHTDDCTHVMATTFRPDCQVDLASISAALADRYPAP